MTSKEPAPWWPSVSRTLLGTYVDDASEGRTILTCGQCEWTHEMTTPFLLGDAYDISHEHRHEKHPHSGGTTRVEL